MNYLELVLPEGVKPVVQYIFGVITLSLINYNLKYFIKCLILYPKGANDFKIIKKMCR